MAALIDKERFGKRASRIYEAWESNEHETMSKVDAIAAIAGSGESPPYSKTQSLQHWLLGYELSDTLILFCKKAVYFLASKKKIDFLKPVESEESKEKLPPVICLTRDKNDGDKANFEKIVEAIKESGNGKVVGHFAKDKAFGDFSEQWKKSISDAELETEDASVPFSLILAPKDTTELTLIKQACTASCSVWTKHLRTQIIEIVDAEKKVRHSKLSETAEAALTDRKVVGGINVNHLETCYGPIIQSGGKYNLKFSAVSDKDPIHFGAICCSFGARYKQYCSNISRTMLVAPDKNIEEIYEVLLAAEDAVIKALTVGTPLSEVYEAGLKVVKKKKPELAEKLTKSFGFATGIEFRDSALIIQPKNDTKVEADIVFIVHVGIGDIPNSSAKKDAEKKVALLLSDTVHVKEDGPECLTETAKKRYKSIAIQFTTEDEEEEKPRREDNKENKRESLGRGKRSLVLQEQLRKKESNLEKIKQHQRELAAQLNESAQARMAQAKNKPTQEKAKKSNVSYKSASSIPKEKEVHDLQIYVDRKYETVILPIFGMPVPFHISVVKNISQSVEGDFTYLRINFFHPGSTIGKDSNQFPNAVATFVKEMTYRSSNLKEPGELNAPSSNLNTAFRLIKEVQKRFKSKEAEEQQKEGIVKQDKLILSQNKGNPRLKDLYIRPNVISKRVPGTLEAHMNGFRYTSLRGDKVDIMYNNIKHAFFQPCDHEMIILLHFHLKNPILFGKKKHKDIQLFTEVGEITTDLGKYHHMQDRDDVYAEQAERELRHKLNLAFKGFCEKVEKMTNQGVEFDTPFRELGFTGVPHRSSVLLQPTSGCLVHLTEWPAFVVTLEEVELVHFERVSFQLKNFDMVFIFKDYHRKVEMVQQVPMNMLDHVKEWMDSCDIRYTEGLQSLNWPKIMKTITDDPDQFFSDGGWNFLGSSDDEGEGEDEEESDEDAYAPSDAEDEDEESDDEDEETPEPSSDDEDSDASVGSEEESGKDWSDLEEEARKADKEKEVFQEEHVDSRKRPRPSGHSSSHHRHRSSGGSSHHKSPHKSSSKSKGPPPKRRK